MFRKSKVSLKGRWMISLIFFWCILVPETFTLITATRSDRPQYVIGMSALRLMWSVPLYYFTMLGHAWARYLTVVLLTLAAVFVLGALSADYLLVLGVPLTVLVASIGVLLVSKHVKPKGWRRV